MSDINEQFARNNVNLSVELIQSLCVGNLRNTIISPFSIQTCLAMAYAGADGNTAKEIATGLKFVSNQRTEVAATFQHVLQKFYNSTLLKIANKIYIKEGVVFNDEYKKEIKEKYHAETEEINFNDSEKAAEKINAWVAKKTNGNILKLITFDCFNEFTRLVLLNALHFKGQWEKKFDKASTIEDNFWFCQRQSNKLEYMIQKARYHYDYNDKLDCTILELPYKDSNLSMLILLPNSREGLKTLITNLTSIDLIEVFGNMKTEDVSIKLPKFKFDFSLELTPTLKKLGINQMFTNSAEFDKMLHSPEPLSVSRVVHKVSIEVNEEGTEAAAATGMIMLTRMAVMPVQFIADHPFLFMIWNKKNILFAGTFVNNPRNSIQSF